jgi:Tn3 transposase DDE domain
LTDLDKLPEPPIPAHVARCCRCALTTVDLPEIILEIAARTKFVGAFSHISERTARAADLDLSVCAVLLAEACNTGFEPLIRRDIPALRRDRLSWVNQNYLRNETLVAANALLAAAQNGIPPFLLSTPAFL